MPPTFTVKGDVDFIALAPVMLGFQPEQSLVMLTINKFHARVDLPDDANIDYVVQMLLEPAVKHEVSQVAFIVFDDNGGSQRLWNGLMDSFTAAGIDVLCAVDVGDHRYRRFGQTEWQSLDLAGHPIMLEAQFVGVAPLHHSREDLAASGQPCGSGWSPATQEAIDELQREGVSFVITMLIRERSLESVELWSEALRGSEPGTELSADIALVLAVVAWLSGDGAADRCAVLIALGLADETSRIHRLMVHMLEHAISPHGWPGVPLREHV